MSDAPDGRVVPAAAPALEFRGVSFSYGAPVGVELERRAVIDGFSLSIPAGGITGIVGPNGCGKSTLLKLADGLLRPQVGRVLVSGRDVAAMSSCERARAIALLPQVHRTPSMTVRDLVMCGRYARMGVFGRAGAADTAAVDEALRALDLVDLARKPARSLSGGERQRAFLAMVLAQGADTLLLDEPTTYLDVAAAHETMALARRLNRERGITAVVVIHDIDLALRSCDHIVVMGSGSVRAEGAPRDPEVLAAIGEAFGASVLPVDTALGRAYAVFAREG